MCFVINNFFKSYGHQFIYDIRTLKALLQEVGFTNAIRCIPGESKNPHLSGIETHGKLIGEERNQFDSIVLEAIRL